MFSKRLRIAIALGSVVLAGAAVPRSETTARTEITGEELRAMPDLWVLEFSYKPPRMIAVEVPGADGRPQRKLIWYVVYRVTNRTGEPRMFVPEFTLVTEAGKRYPDKVIPVAQKVIAARENPLESLQNSATVGGPVPPSPAEGLDRSVYGVATWEGVDPATDYFSIFVTGLSNGYKVIRHEDGQTLVQRKTLELKYWRPGDEFLENEKEIRFLESRWIYR